MLQKHTNAPDSNVRSDHLWPRWGFITHLRGGCAALIEHGAVTENQIRLPLYRPNRRRFFRGHHNRPVVASKQAASPESKIAYDLKTKNIRSTARSLRGLRDLDSRYGLAYPAVPSVRPVSLTPPRRAVSETGQSGTGQIL